MNFASASLSDDRVRLAALSALAGKGVLSLGQVRHILALPPQQVHACMRQLEDAGHVSRLQLLEGRLAYAEYSITSAGRTCLAEYLDHLESVLHQPVAG